MLTCLRLLPTGLVPVLALSSTLRAFFAIWRYARTRRTTRGIAVALLGLAAVALLLVTVDDLYPVRDWLFWRLLGLWAASALLHAGCVATGYLIVTRGLGLRTLPPLEKLVVSMAVGLVAFVIAMYVAGALAWFTPVLSIALPVAMIAMGGPAVLVDLAQARQHRRFVDAAAGFPRPTPRPLAVGRLETAVFIVGLLCLALVYLQCLTPASLNYDSRWYHLSVAEDYAREGRIVPFLADYNRAYPQLTALLHTWAWLVPGLDHGVRCMLALHTEFFLFVWTLAGVSAGAGWLLDDARAARVAGMAFFLFPVIYVYDSNIGGSADRILAFFAAPLFLAAARTAREHPFSPRWAALCGICAGGAVLTKYQAVFLLVPVALIVGGGWLWAVLRKRSLALRDLLAPAVLAGCFAAVVSPHFLKNWIFYRNPIYPFENRFFPGWPRVPDTALLWGKINLSDVTPHGSWSTRLADAVLRLVRMPFRRPYAFGFTFNLLVPALCFLPRARRIWLGVLAGVAAILTWGWLVTPNDRYAMAFLPWLVMVVAAISVRAWELGRIARVGVVAVLATQLVWNGDVYFAAGADRMADAVRLIRSGLDGKAQSRFDRYNEAERAIAKRIPADALVLYHYTRLSLGLNRKVLQDLPSFQGLLTTRQVHSARELWELYRSYGITHVVHEPGWWPVYTRQEEVVFAALLAQLAKNRFREGPYEAFELPTETPPPEAPYKVLSLGMDGYANGVYPVEAMGVYDMLPSEDKHYPAPTTPVTAETAGTSAVIDGVHAVLMSNDYQPRPALAEVLRTQFQNVITYRDHGRLSVYIRIAPPKENP
jgi:hypothetical protein